MPPPATPPARARPPLLAGVVLLVALAGALLFALRIPPVAAGEVWTGAVSWVPALGVDLAFRLDGLSLLFGLLVTGAGFFVALYAVEYLKGHPHLGRFYLFFLLFMVAMVGLVLADDLITLFVFWELTTVASFLLIGFEHENRTARRNARQALLVTGLGGLAMLAGFLLLGAVADSYRIGALIAAGDTIRAHPHYTAILVLVLLGAFTKSAQFPFHFWLPNAMAAPTPVSAYLHSATMVKAGIYLLARLHPVLGYTPSWAWTLTIVGAVTAVWGAVLSMRQTDMKTALAWTTVMALGTLTLFLGSDQAIGLAAAMTFLVVHALYKCTLFLVVGNVDHGTGTRDVTKLAGLRRAMPVTAAAALVAALSMGGFPPFLGFLGKELKYEGALAVASEPWFAATASVVANALMVAMAGVLAWRPFFRGRERSPQPPHEAGVAMLAGPVVLGGLGLLLGILPPFVDRGLITPAVAAIVREPVELKFKLWHGITLPLVLSAVTIAAGIALYLAHAHVRRALAGALARLRWTGDRLYDVLLGGIGTVSGGLTRRLQNGSLGWYLFVTFSATAVAVGVALLRDGVPPIRLAGPAVPFADLGAAVLVAAGAVVVLAARTRLVAISGLGALGAGVGLLFLLYGGPDVAITQLLVEVLVVVIVALVLPRLPRFRGTAHPGRGGRVRDALVATLFGVSMAVLVLLVAAAPPDPRVAQYYETASVPEAHGRNIVNVVLVDFRALDTLGEITVVAVAGFAAHALLARRRRGTEAP